MIGRAWVSDGVKDALARVEARVVLDAPEDEPEGAPRVSQLESK